MTSDKQEIYRDRFLALQKMVYLDSASFGISSDRVVNAQIECLRLLAEMPPVSPDGLAFWEEGNIPSSISSDSILSRDWKGIYELRKTCAEVLGCDSSTISLCENTTNAFETLVSRIKWASEDEIIITDLEHDSIKNICELISHTKGVTLCQVAGRDLIGHIDFKERLKDRIIRELNAHTRMVVISHIFYNCGLISDPRILVDAIKTSRRDRDTETIVVIDGAHALGQIPIKVKDYGCDAYVTSGSKWLLAPPGTGILYVAPWHQEIMWPADVYDADLPDWWETKRRQLRYSSLNPEDYVLGVTPQVALIGLRSAIADYLEVGVKNVYSQIGRNAKNTREMLSEVGGYTLQTSINGATGMIFISKKGWGIEDVSRTVKLLRQKQIIVASIKDPPSIRISTHYFNNNEDVKNLAVELSRITRH